MNKTVLTKNGVILVDNSTQYETAWFVYDGCDLIIGDVTESCARKTFNEVVDNKAPTSPVKVAITDKVKPGKIWNKDEIKNLILTNDKMVGRSLIQLWEHQTRDEQQAEETKHTNGVGFNGLDAKILSSFAQWFKKTGKLSDKQLVLARKKLVKYSGQLTKIANGVL